MRYSSLLCVVLSALTVSGVSVAADYSKTYPKQVHDNFLASCVKAGVKEAGTESKGMIQKTCVCSVNALEKNISYSDFKKADQSAGNTSAQTPEVQAIQKRMSEAVTACIHKE